MPEKSEQKQDSIPLRTDPASGQFIVADILPPHHKSAHTVAAKPSAPKKQKTTHEIPVRAGSKKTVPRESKNTEAVDAWFRKESALRNNSPATAHPLSLRNEPSSKKRTRFIWLSVFVILLAGGYGISYAMSRLEIDITLKTQPHDFDQTISIAVKPALTDTLSGERVEVSDSVSATFKASGSADVSAKAKGTITIYNAFNTSPQPLVANTRFETTDGKIYRIREAVTIPKAVMEHGTLSPRSIDVMVYADEPGPAYNRDKADFTIPGFKGSPRYAGFYARSKTPLEGGHVGMATVVTEADIDKARESLESQARTRVMDSLKKSIPEGFTLLDDAIEITSDKRTFSHESDDVTDEFSATITLRGRALVFKKDDLVTFFTKQAGLDPLLVSLPKPETITLAMERRNVEAGNLILHAKGTGIFVWNLDTQKLASDVIQSKNADALMSMFQQHPAIERAEYRFIPSWIQNIPRDPAHIRITTMLKNNS